MATSTTPHSGSASSVFFLAELPYHELLRKRDPQKAMKLEARMQQILGEAVYEYDGRVIDSIGPRMIAVLPAAGQAVKAATKARLDLLEHNRRQPPSGEVVEAALVVHSGPAVSDGSAFSSPTVATGLQLLRSMQPGQLLISELVLREAGVALSGSPVGEAAGMRFFEPPVEEPKPAAAPHPPPKAAAAPVPVKRRALPMPLIAAGGAVLVIGIASVLLLKRDEPLQTGPTVRTVGTTTTTQPAIAKQRVTLQPATGATDAASAARLTRVEQIVRELLGRNSRIELSDSSDATLLSIAFTPGRPATLLPTAASQSGTAVPVEPAGPAAAAILGFFADALAVPRHELTSADPAVMSRLSDAIAAYRPTDPRARARSLTLLQGVIDADPTFIAALRLGVDWFAESGDRVRAVQAAESLLVHEPGDLTVRRKAAFWQIEQGNPERAIPHLGALLRGDPSDGDALLAIGRMALSAGDDATFRRASARLQRLGDNIVLHEPDLLAARGQIDAAVKAYYSLERADPNNAALALKIGRIAVLRHSLSIAELELEKLRRLDPAYGYPLLQAYVSAENRLAGDAVRYLQQAQQADAWSNDTFTASAEVFAILNDARVLESLKNAEGKGEATATYILTNPLFRYLNTESEFAALKKRLEEERIALSGLLAELDL